MCYRPDSPNRGSYMCKSQPVLRSHPPRISLCAVVLVTALGDLTALAQYVGLDKAHIRRHDRPPNL
jgi:hypothetical protein